MGLRYGVAVDTEVSRHGPHTVWTLERPHPIPLPGAFTHLFPCWSAHTPVPTLERGNDNTIKE